MTPSVQVEDRPSGEGLETWLGRAAPVQCVWHVAIGKKCEEPALVPSAPFLDNFCRKHSAFLVGLFPLAEQVAPIDDAEDL